MANIAYFLLTLSILVTFHEYGHYWVARRCGVRVLRFSVGFGSPLFKWYNAEGTEFVIAAIPLGGYVKMLDEREAPVETGLREFAFNQKSVSQRAAIVSAGPVANFILALFVYWLVYLIGVSGIKPVVGEVEIDAPAYTAGIQAGDQIVSIDGHAVASLSEVQMRLVRRIGDSGEIQLGLLRPDSWYHDAHTLPQGYPVDVRLTISEWMSGTDQPNPIDALGISLWRGHWPTLLDSVVPDSPADRAGLKAGDRIVSVGGQQVESWSRLTGILREKPRQSVSLEVLRNSELLSISLTPDAIEHEGKTIGRIGVTTAPPELPEGLLVVEHRGVLEALLKATDRTVEMIGFTLQSIKKILVGLLSPSSLSGPITIAKVAASSAESGLVPYLSLLALLSISLGVFNLLPIPVLDGGHLLFITCEAVMRRPLPERVQLAGQQFGLFLILGIMAFALYNDITHF